MLTSALISTFLYGILVLLIVPLHQTSNIINVYKKILGVCLSRLGVFISVSAPFYLSISMAFNIFAFNYDAHHECEIRQETDKKSFHLKILIKIK